MSALKFKPDRSVVPGTLISSVLALAMAMAAPPLLAQESATPLASFATTSASVTSSDTSDNRRDCGKDKLPAPEQGPPKLVCAIDFDIRPQACNVSTGDDLGDRLRDALKQLKRGSSLYLPAGCYAFTGPLKLRAGTGLVGATSGETRLVNTGQRSGNIVFRGDKATAGVRIEGLQLHNTRIVLDALPASTVRWVGIAGTKGKEAQIMVARGDHTIEGNVLWRTSGEPGVGIQIGRVKDAKDTAIGQAQTPPDTAKVIIKENLIGAIDAHRLTEYGLSGIPARVPELAAAMLSAEKGAYVDKGHYFSAIQSTTSASVDLLRNAVALSPPTSSTVGPRSRRAMADLVSPRRLHVSDNSFNGLSTATPFRVLNPWDVSFEGNYFNETPLTFAKDPDHKAPPKRVSVYNSTFTRSPLSVEFAVNGSGDEHTGPNDVKLVGNIFYGMQTCPIRLLTPEAGHANFIEQLTAVRFPDRRKAVCVKDPPSQTTTGSGSSRMPKRP